MMKNFNFSRVISMVLTCAMVMTMFVSLPVMAEEDGGEAVLNKFDKIRKDTNLYGTNYGFEKGAVSGNTAYGVDNWAFITGAGGSSTFTAVTEQSAEGDYSALFSKTGSANGWGRTFYPNSGYNANKTYVHSAKVLGTATNGTTYNALGSVYQTGQYAEKIKWAFSLYNGETSDITTIAQTKSDDGWDGIRLGQLITDIEPGVTTEKADASEWKELYTIFKVNKEPGAITPYMHHVPSPVDFYFDDYYFGELMVADVVTAMADSVNIPVNGMDDATLELTASALNQLGNADGLDGTTYTWAIKGDTPEGVSLSDNVLTVTKEAKAQSLTLTVTANPTFAGANEQSDEIKAYRTEDVIITLKEVSKIEALINATNLYGDNAGFELGNKDSWEIVHGYGQAGSMDMDVVSAQSYSGDKSALLWNSTGTHLNYGYKIPASSVRANTTYIASTMALGTETNLEGRKNDSSWNNSTWAAVYSITAAKIPATNKAFTAYSGADVTKVVPGNLASAPAAATANQTKLGKDAWTNFTAAFVSDGLSGKTEVMIPYLDYHFKGMEWYVDDLYFGELFVADVDVTADKNEVIIPVAGQEAVKVNLTAKALNQLGTDYMLADSTYKWTLKNEAQGISISDGVLTVDGTAKAQDVVIVVESEPKFTGHDTQTGLLTANRTKEITISVIEDRFEGIKNMTNWFGNKSGVESGSVDGWNAYAGYNSAKGTVEVATAQAYEGQYSALVKQGNGVSGSRYLFYDQWYEPSKTYIASAMVLGTEKNMDIFNNDNLTGTQWEPKLQLDLSEQNTGVVAGDGNYLRVNEFSTAPALDDENQPKADKDEWKEVYRVVTTNSTEPAYIGMFVRYNPGNLEIYTDNFYIGELQVADVECITENAVIPATGSSETVLTAQSLNQLGNEAGLGGTTYTWSADSLPDGVTLTEEGVLTVSSTVEPQDITLTVTANPTFAGADLQTDVQKAYRTKDVTITLADPDTITFEEAEDGKVTAKVFFENDGDQAVNYMAYAVIYKTVDGADVMQGTAASKALQAEAGAKNAVVFESLDIPEGAFLKVLFWKDNVTCEPVAPAKTYSK